MLANLGLLTMAVQPVQLPWRQHAAGLIAAARCAKLSQGLRQSAEREVDEMETRRRCTRRQKPSRLKKTMISAVIARLFVGALEPSDWAGIAVVMKLPKLRCGTPRLPFTSKEQWRKRMEKPPEDRTGLIPALDGRIAGTARIDQNQGQRHYVGKLGICVHDDFQGRGVGATLLALFDVAQAEPVIGLYQKFGSEVEGTGRADACGDGPYVNSFAIARLRPGWSPQP
jgi:L-phenylalanine/L-methionine N-acetyltransferase